MKKSIVVMLVVGLMLTGFSESFAKKRNNRNNRNFNRGEQIVKLLKLTDVQLNKFNELRFAHRADVIDVETKIEKHRLAVQKMMVTGTVNEAKLLEITGDISGFRGQLVELRTKNWLAVYKMLNNDQKLIWKNNFQRMRGRSNDGFRNGSRRGSRNGIGNRDGSGSGFREGSGNRDGSGAGLMRSGRNFRNN